MKNGNLAFEQIYENGYRYAPGYAEPQTAPNTTARSAHSRKMKARRIIAAIVVISFVFAVAFFLVGREIDIYQKNIAATELANKVEQYRNKNKIDMAALEDSIDIASIERIAEEQFYMIQPGSGQITRINIWQEDYVEKIATGEAGGNAGGGMFGNLFGIFSAN